MGRMKDAGLQIIAGGSAGFTEICVMHPLDLIKTRFQVQSSLSSDRYRSLADCFVKIYRTEGFMSFYKGILPPILAETPKRATKFFTFEQYKNLFSFPELPPAMIFSMAGLFSGFTEAVVVNPFEVVKVGLQAEQGVTLTQQKGSFQSAREIIAKDGFGLNGLNRGLTATLMRHGIWNMVYFGLYHTVKEYYPPPKTRKLNFLYRVSVGFTAGSLASVVNIPFDVAKSRIQGPQPKSGRKYHTTLQSISLVFREEGYIALYRGLLPKIMRLGPGGALMMVVYENMLDFLRKTF